MKFNFNYFFFFQMLTTSIKFHKNSFKIFLTFQKYTLSLIVH